MEEQQQKFREMLEKKVDIAHWAAHTANEEILMSVIKELQDVGYDIKKDINLNKRMEFFQTVKLATILSHREPDSFERLLKTFDRMMTQYAEQFDAKGIHMYRWLHMRDKLMIQMGLVVLYKHMKFSFSELPNVPNALIVPSSWNAGNYVGELKSRLENHAPTYNFKTADKELYQTSFEGRVFLKLTDFVHKSRKVDIVKMYDVFFENRLPCFVRDYCAFVAEAEKNALKSPFMVISQYYSGQMEHFGQAIIKTEPDQLSSLQHYSIPTQSTNSEDLHDNTPLSPLPVQHDTTSSASNDRQGNRDKTASPHSSGRGQGQKKAIETAERSITGLRHAQNVLKKSDEIDPLNDIEMDSDLPETRATVGTKRKVSAAVDDDATATSENFNINVQLQTATSSSKNPVKSLGGPRPGAQKVSPADSDDESDLFNSDDDTIRNMSSALNNSKPQKQNFPDKLAHPTERERKRIGKVIPEVPGGRRKWSLEEEEALINGYTKYENQKEMWSKILNDPAFSETLKYRDNVALKDKWRRLARK